MRNFLFLLGSLAALFTGQYLTADACSCIDEASCCQECCYDNGTCEFGIDWLYWKSSQDGLEIAAEVQGVAGTEPEVDFRILRPKFRLDSGVRLTGSYQPCDQNWKVSGIFTHMPTSARVSNFSDPNTLESLTIYNFLSFPLLLAGAELAFNSSPYAHWNLKVNYFDIDFSRIFSCCECLEFRPHVGLRGFWMNQKVAINGTGPDISFRSVMRQKFQGYGLESGVDVAWNLNCGFSVVTHIGGALLYSDIRGSGTVDDTILNTEIAAINYKDRVHKSTPMIDTFVGFQYVGCWWDRVVSMRAGWEQHILFEASQFNLVGTGGNLTMQGLTLGGGVTF